MVETGGGIRPLSNTKFVNQMSIVQKAYMVALDVTNMVLFVLFGAMLDRIGGGKWFTDLTFAA